MANLFGYWGNSFSFLGDAVSRTSAYSNLTWVHGSDVDVVPRIERARRMGHRVIVVVQAVIFEERIVVTSAGRTSLYTTTMLPNAEAKLSEWWAKIADHSDIIEALFLCDEPYRQNERAIGFSTAVVTANLDAASVVVKRVTGKRTMIAGAGNEFDSFGVPRSVDWIGMYRYSYNTGTIALTYSFLNLLWKLSSSQRMVAVVDAFEMPGRPVDQTRIIKYNKTWRSLVGWSTRVVAVCPFIFQTTPMGTGAESMPLVEQDLARWGAEIITPSLV